MGPFLSNAFCFLNGKSSLPSTLPAREAIDRVKEESRKIRLFCKGLEHFRQVFYEDVVCIFIPETIFVIVTDDSGRMRAKLLLPVWGI